MIGTIQQANKSKSGKTLSIQINNVWYTSKNWELEQSVGRTVIFEPATQTFPDGASIQWLNDYVFEDQSTTPAGMAMDAAMARQPAPAQAPQRAVPNKDSLIGAMALSKCCTLGSPEQVFENFRLLYNKLENWDPTVPF